MVKASRSGSQKAGSNDIQANKGSAQAQPTGQPSTNIQASKSSSQTQPASVSTDQKKGKQSSKSRQSRVGGTAVAGAKSTQQKELTTGSPANQQPEYYNRDTRRRMEHMGTGPYTERTSANDPRERRKKRKERLEERQERIKHLVDARGPSRNVKLGRRNTLFLIGIAAVLVILIVAFIIIRHPF